jgi:hypothetical protein
LWPRFQASVEGLFDKRKVPLPPSLRFSLQLDTKVESFFIKVDLVDLNQSLSYSMTTLQKSVFEIMDVCLKELKQTNQVG